MKYPFTDFQWFRYINKEPFNTTQDGHVLNFGRREVYGIMFDSQASSYALVDLDVPDLLFYVTTEQAQTLVASSRPYTGKVKGHEVAAGSTLSAIKVSSGVVDTGIDFGKTVSDDDEPSAVPKVVRHITSSPKQKQINWTMLQKPKAIKSPGMTFRYLPLTDAESKLWEKAKDHIGNLIQLKLPYLKVSTNTDSTHILTMQVSSARKEVHLSLCMDQLRRINGGVLDHRIIAQATTHELAHYVVKSALKNSHLLKWKRTVGGLNIHKEQYSHGYTNPWWDEHFAMMAEFAVHGRCARELQSTVGIEIVEQYFDNRYLRDVPESKFSR